MSGPATGPAGGAPLLDVASYRNEAGEPPGYCDFARFGPPTRSVLERDRVELARISTGGTDCDELVPYRDEAQRLVASLTGRREPDQVVMDASFANDLDADSLDLVELIMALEDEFSVSVPESELEGVDTVGKAFELVYGKLS